MQGIQVTAASIGVWALHSMGVSEHSLMGTAAAALAGLAGNRLATAIDLHKGDREWWRKLLVNQNVAAGMATTIQRILEEEAAGGSLKCEELVKRWPALAYEGWLELSQEGAIFIADLQDSNVLTPLAGHMEGEKVQALDPETWCAFLLMLVDRDGLRADEDVQEVAAYLGGVIHRRLFSEFFTVISNDIDGAGPLFGAVVLRFLGRLMKDGAETKGIAAETKGMVTEILHLHRGIAAGSQRPPRELPPAAGRYFGRTGLVDELAALLRSQLRAYVTGGPGVGKTALAAEAVGSIVGKDDAALAAGPFPDGVVFLNLYPHREDLTSAWQNLANAFDRALPTNQTAKARVRQACAGRKALVILHRAEVLGTRLEGFLSVLSPETKVLVLTTNRSQTVASCRVVIDDLLDDAEALGLLRHLAGSRVPMDVTAAVQKRLGGHPQVITWAGHHLADIAGTPHRLAGFVEEIRAGRLARLTEPGGDPSHTLDWIFSRNVDLLDPVTRDVLAAAARVGAIFDLTMAEAVGGSGDDLQRLRNLGLLRETDDGWRFPHTHLADYARRVRAPTGLLAKLGGWAMEGIVAAAKHLHESEDSVPLDLVLGHATTLLGHDLGGEETEALAESLLHHGDDKNLIGRSAGRLDFSRRTVVTLLAWYEAAHARRGDHDSLRELGVVRSQSGFIAWLQGDLAAAAPHYSVALGISTELAAIDPGNRKWQGDLSSNHIDMGKVQEARGNLTSAKEHYLTALRISEGLMASSEGEDRAEAALGVVTSRNHLGHLALTQGDLTAASGHYSAALDLEKEFTTDSSSHGAWMCRISTSHDGLGRLEMHAGELVTARGHFIAARDLRSRRTATNPGRITCQSCLLDSDINLGLLAFEFGELASAHDHFTAVMDVAGQRAETDTTNVSWSRNLTQSYDKLGEIAMIRGAYASARTYFDESLDVRKRLVADDPDNTVRWHDLSVSHERLGDLFHQQGEAALARGQFDAALKLRRKLTAKDGSNQGWQRDISLLHDRLGELALSEGDPATARGHYKTSMEIRRRLVKESPANTTWQRELSLAHEKLGDLLYGEGEAAAAREHFDALLKIRLKLAASDPANVIWQRDLSIAHDRIGECEKQVGNRASAREHFSTALEIRERIADLDPANQVWQRDLGVSHEKLGDLLIHGMDPEVGRAHYVAVLQIRTRLFENNPGKKSYVMELASTYDRFGDLAKLVGFQSTATDFYLATLDLIEGVTGKNPENANWQRNLALAHCKVGHVCCDRGDHAKARKHYEAALAIRLRLCETDPANTLWQHDLAMSYRYLGRLEDVVGELGRASEHYTRSIEILRSLVDGDPENVEWQMDLSIGFILLGDVICSSGNYPFARMLYDASRKIRDYYSESYPSNQEFLMHLAIAYERLVKVANAVGDNEGAAKANQALAETLKRMEVKDGPEDTEVEQQHAEFLAGLTKNGT